MIVLDASVVIAFLDPGDAHHDAAQSLIVGELGKSDESVSGFALHPLTLAEILVGGVRVGRAHQLLADLRSVGIVPIPSPPDEPLLLAELRTTTGLKMPDCCVLVVALAQSAPLATFDSRLARAALALGLRVLPQADAPA
ncbi:type II toxin-antitoxin system VapC family toxin [Cryobacterium glaciale]|uniref:Ribonuclease VapC n=1 Tax=Cryobacterium glaciale TaxID=1259145 RepID=A0A4R8UVG6_9MICO|nr:type II toxin-antitoxin system VapC family toxin [Cryobacterium glaciale]TFB72082.1 type II toxin-antitoxin system VapC family toxin [Cryobacterium glaciale]